MGAVVSSLGSAAASGLTNLVALGLLSWTAAAAIEACEGSLEDEAGEWRLIKCVLATGGRVRGGLVEGGGESRAGLEAGRGRRLRSPRDSRATPSRSRRHSPALVGKQSQGGASCRLYPSSATPAGSVGGGGGGNGGKVTVESSPPVALASTGRRNDRGGVDDGADRDRDDDHHNHDDSVERGGSDGDDDERRDAVRLGADGCAQLGPAGGATAVRVSRSKPGSRRAQPPQSGRELAPAAGRNCAQQATPASSARESALCVAGGNCATTDCARSAARSSPCRFYYCSSSLGTNAGDDRASAPQQSRMLSIAPAAAATKSAAASTRMTNSNNNNKHTTSSDNISKIHLQINNTDNKNSKQAPIGNPKQIPDLAMEPIGGRGGRQRSIVIKSRQTQFAQTKSAASSLDSGHSSSGGSSSRGSQSDLSLPTSNIINNLNNNLNNNNNNNDEDEEREEDYMKTGANMLHPTVSALLQSTANLTLARNQPQNHFELVVDVDTPPPSPLKRSKKMQPLHAGDQLSFKHQRTSFDHHHHHHHQQQQAPQAARHQEQQHHKQHHLCESTGPTPASCLQEQRPPTQDATYLAEVPDRNHLIELLAAARPRDESRPPPRPWLSPVQQLQFLSKGRLKQLFQEGRFDRRQYEQLLEVRPSRRCAAAKSKWGQQAARSSATSSDNLASKCQSSRASEFTVLSYNVLSDRMVNPKQFPSSPDLALNWLYRSELILRQLLDHDADIVALQEIEMEQFESFFRPKLEELGHYAGLFESKSRARTMEPQMRKRVDGCAIFYKQNKFKLVDKHLLEFNQIAMANSRGSEAMLNRVMTRDNIGLVAVLELVDHDSLDSDTGDSIAPCRRSQSDLDDEDDDETFLEYSPELRTSSGSSRTTSTSNSTSSGSTSSASTTTTATTTTTSASKRIIVCNTHIHWDPNYCDVKLIQTIMLMNELRHIARHYRSGGAAQLPAPVDGAARLDESREEQQIQQQQPEQARTPSADDDADDDDDLTGEPLVPLVLLGDFNSMQKSGVVKFLLDGAIDSSHKDFKEFTYTPCTTALTLLGRRRRQHEAQQQQLQMQRLAGPNLNHLLVSRRASDQAAQLASGQTGPSSSRLQMGSTGSLSGSLVARRQSSPVTCSDSSQTSSPLPHSPLTAASQAGAMTGVISYEHPFKLASAYEKGVMPFTNYCTHFKATIDYIFYDDHQLQLLASLGPLDNDWLKRSKLKGFPQMDFPSDHLPLMAKFRLVSGGEDLDDGDDRSSLSQLSSIETSSSTLTIPNNWRPSPPVVPTMAKPTGTALMPAMNQQRNQRKQLLYINQNLRMKPQPQQLATAAPVTTLPRSIRADEQVPSTWFRLRRDSPPMAASNQQQEPTRPEPQNRHQGGNTYHCYFPNHHLKQHLERQRQLQLNQHRAKQHQQHMQFTKERVESCNQIKTNTIRDDDDDQDGIKQAADAANSRRPAKQSSRRQLQRKLKQIRPEKAWPGKPLLVKLKEDWS